MAVVTEHLVQLIAKQVDDKGLVVWYDPEQAYGSAAAELTLPNTTVARFDGSFLKLRKEIDHLMNDGQPSRLVVYVPTEREKTHAALIELDAAGVVMQPRQQPPACNTRLSVVARNALKPILGEDQVGEIERQVEAGKLSLADLNSLAEKGKDIATGVLTLIFGSANPQEVALAFLNSDDYDDQIVKKEALNEIRHLLQVSFQIEIPSAETLLNWRMKLARHILATDLFAALKEDVPNSLSSVSAAYSAGAIDACVRLARTWRNSREHRDSYVAAAIRTEKELNLTALDFPVVALFENDTFLCVEQRILAYVEQELLNKSTQELLELAGRRLARFWSDVEPSIQARWALISCAGQVLLESDRIAKDIKNAPTTIPALVKSYTDDDQPWCMLDTYHRHMESRKYNFEFIISDKNEGLERLITRAEQRYSEVGSELSKHFVNQFVKAKHPIQGMLRQRDFFEKQVKPQLTLGKVAYVWVDALRYEMARELAQLLTDDFSVEVQPAIGTMPTITEIGMAALLPKAHESAKVVGVGGGKLALEIEGKVIKDRKDRIAFLKEHAGASVFDAKLDDLLPKPNKKVKDGIQSNHLILITSQEIDELGEADNMTQARLQIDGVLSHLRRGLRVLADHGIKTIILAADHGHLFADEIGEDMKIDSPGGLVEDLHRRVWVGVGGTAGTSYVRAPLKSLGIDSELDIATPWTFAVFKSKGGGRAYFHGGLSPQELIVPIVTLHAKKKLTGSGSTIDWQVIPGSTKLATRFISIQVHGCQKASSLFELEPPRIKIEIRENRTVVSQAVSSSYGFLDATAEVQLETSKLNERRIEPVSITLMVTEELKNKVVSIHLLDAATSHELTEPLKIENAISI